MKKILSLTMTMLLILALFTGCAGKASTGDQEASSDKITLKFYGYGLMSFTNVPGYEDNTKNMGDIYRVMADEFTKEHPNVTIDVEVINPAGGNTEQLDIDISSGNVPDLYLDNQMRLSKYNGLGLLADLTPYLDQDNIDDYVKGTFSGDTIWRLPIDMDPTFMVINKSIFEKIGKVDLLPSPESREWTTDQYIAALKAVKDAGLKDVYPTILWAQNPSGDVCNMGFLWGTGARMFADGDYSKTTLNSKQGLEAFKLMNEVVQDGLAVPGAAGLNDDDMLAMWPKQQIAMTGAYNYLEKQAEEALADGTATAPFEPYFVNYPHSEGQPNTPFAVYMTGISVFKSDDEARQAMAAEFAKFIIDKFGVALCNAAGTSSPRMSFADDVKISDQTKIMLKKIEQNGIVDYGSACPRFQEIRDIYAPTLQAMFTGAKTPEQALSDFEKDVNKLLTE